MFPRNLEEKEIFRNERVNSSIGKMISESYSKTSEEKIYDILTSGSFEELFPKLISSENGESGSISKEECLRKIGIYFSSIIH